MGCFYAVEMLRPRVPGQERKLINGFSFFLRCLPSQFRFYTLFGNGSTAMISSMEADTCCEDESKKKLRCSLGYCLIVRSASYGGT